MATAAGPYIVDDASIVAQNTVQSESWLSHTDTSETIAVVNAAYRVMNSEISLQETHDNQSGDRSDILSPQVKYQWRASGDGRVESSLVVGGSYNADASTISDLYAYIPATVTFTDALDLSINLGWHYTKTQERQYATWGIGSEYHATPSLSLVSEVFGRNTELPGFQLGPRATFTDHLQFDAVYGHNVFGTSEDMVTAGLTINF